jgi:hypothetical protein
MADDDVTGIVDDADGRVTMAREQRTADRTSEEPEVSEGRRRLVEEWLDKIRQAKVYWENHGFRRMRECQQLATFGADRTWIDAGSYVAPIAPRHINTMVSALYAKDPRAIATRKKRMLYQLWDGDPESLKLAMMAVQSGDPMQIEAAKPLLEEIDAVKQYNLMVDRMGKTLECLWMHFTTEQQTEFKSRLKMLIRRTKVNGVGYVRLGFQREMAKDPDVCAEISDTTEKLKRIEVMLAEMQEKEGEYDEQSKEAECLRLQLEDLASRQEIIVREGPVFSYPRSDKVIIDPEVEHLKTLAGAGWWAQEYEYTPSKVREVFGVDIGSNYTKYSTKTQGRRKSDDKCTRARCYIVECKTDQTSFAVCEGYPDFLRVPAEPDVKIERFFTLFPLVFNEVENDEEKIPPSDVWLMRHPQQEVNRSRQGLREHRVANKPRWAVPHGALEEADLKNLGTSPAHSIFQVQGLRPEDDIRKKLQAIPTAPISQELYETDSAMQDILRAVGSQEANLGPTSGDTATEASIAEHSRASSITDNVDELDDLLTALARSTGQLLMLEMSKEKVQEIVGPGAVWPDLPPTREEISKELTLSIRAGSSGRPNAAAELAKLERATPMLVQLPGISPKPLAQKYCDLLDFDIDELYAAGLPSITALNAMATKAAAGAQPGTGDPASDPNQQGGEGGQNAERPQQEEPQSQPAYPGPASGQAPAQNQSA